MTTNSVCNSFLNFQLYNNVHTTVPVYTATGVDQHIVAMQETNEDGSTWFNLALGFTTVTCDSFADVVNESYWWLVGEIGSAAVDAMSNQGGSN